MHCEFRALLRTGDVGKLGLVAKPLTEAYSRLRPWRLNEPTGAKSRNPRKCQFSPDATKEVARAFLSLSLLLDSCALVYSASLRKSQLLSLNRQEKSPMHTFKRLIDELASQKQFLVKLAMLGLIGYFIGDSGCTDGRRNFHEALRRAQEELNKGDLVLAADFMRAAIQIEPSSPSVFEAAADLVESAAASQMRHDRQTANELAGQLEEMIPLQPIAKLEQCRKRCRAISAILSKSQPSSRSSTERLLQRLASEDVPAPMRGVLLKAALAHLQQLGLARFRKQDPISPRRWQDWWNRYQQIKTAERRALAAR